MGGWRKAEGASSTEQGRMRLHRLLVLLFAAQVVLSATEDAHTAPPETDLALADTHVLLQEEVLGPHQPHGKKVGHAHGGKGAPGAKKSGHHKGHHAPKKHGDHPKAARKPGNKPKPSGKGHEASNKGPGAKHHQSAAHSAHNAKRYGKSKPTKFHKQHAKNVEKFNHHTKRVKELSKKAGVKYRHPRPQEEVEAAYAKFAMQERIEKRKHRFPPIKTREQAVKRAYEVMHKNKQTDYYKRNEKFTKKRKKKKNGGKQSLGESGGPSAYKKQLEEKIRSSLKKGAKLGPNPFKAAKKEHKAAHSSAHAELAKAKKEEAAAQKVD